VPIKLEDVAMRFPTLAVLDELRDSDAARTAIAEELFEKSPWDDIPLGSILPGLASCPESLPGRGLGRRASNVLGLARCRRWKEFSALSPQAVRHFPNLGRKTFTEIIVRALGTWADVLSENLDAPALTEINPLTEDFGALEQTPFPLRGDLITDMAIVLRNAWEGGATTVSDAIQIKTELGETDKKTSEAWSRLNDTDLADALGIEHMNSEAWRRLISFEDRDRSILADRMFGVNGKPTLDELALRFGVTRERIRQRESSIADTLASRLAGPDALWLRHHAARLRSRGLLFDEEQLEREVDQLLPEGTEELLRRILISLAGPFVTWERFRVTGELASELQATAEGFRERGAGTRVDVEELERLRSLVGQEHYEEVLVKLGVREIEGVTVVDGRRQAEKVIAVLAAVGRPLTFGEIHILAGFDIPPRSLQNSIASEPRLIRRGKDIYGLRDWGGDEYTGIVQELERGIDRSGGQVDLDEIVERCANEYGVSPASVRSYVKDSRFIVRDGRWLAMRTAADPELQVAHKPIELTAGTTYLDGVWHLRCDVDSDLMRGSGRPIRTGAAQAVGLEPGLMVGIEFDAGPVTFSWRNPQPSVGSVRAVINLHACVEGDLLLIPLSGMQPRAARVVRGSERSKWTGVKRLSAELGLDPTEVEEDEMPLDVSVALGLPLGADWYEIVDRLRDRGDKILLSFLPEHLK
jgi:hypothetical protein